MMEVGAGRIGYRLVRCLGAELTTTWGNPRQPLVCTSIRAAAPSGKSCLPGPFFYPMPAVSAT